MAKPQRRAVTPLRGEVRPQKRFCPLQTCSPYSKPSQPPLGAWRAGRVHPHLFSVWQLGDALSFPLYSPSFRRRRAACLGTQSILPCSIRTCRGFTATGRGQTAKAFLPASNVLSSLKTVTATPRGLACGSSSSSFILGLAVGGRIVFPLLQSVLSPPAGRVCGDTVDSPLQRSDPVLATCQSSNSHSINPDKDAKGSPSWRRVPLLTIRSGYTFQFGEYPPRLDGVSTDDSKQRLQGFCSTAVAFLPPTERSNRGNTAVGHRTRVLQPKGYGGLRPILDLRRLNFSLYKGKFKMLTMRTIMSCGLATSKQRISHWVRDAISLAYEARELPSPLSLRAHSTRGVASSQALFRGVPLEDICVAAGWSSPHTFVRFYNLDVDTAPGSQVLSV